MPRRNRSNNYQGADCSSILKGYGSGPGARSSETTKAAEQQPQPQGSDTSCAWRFDTCSSPRQAGRDLCYPHMTEVLERSRANRAKKSG